jgi:hypothetical protein
MRTGKDPGGPKTCGSGSPILPCSLTQPPIPLAKKYELISDCCSVSKRPDRLISKLKTMNIEEVARGGPRIIVVRQPRYSWS